MYSRQLWVYTYVHVTVIELSSVGHSINAVIQFICGLAFGWLCVNQINRSYKLHVLCGLMSKGCVHNFIDSNNFIRLNKNKNVLLERIYSIANLFWLLKIKIGKQMVLSVIVWIDSWIYYWVLNSYVLIYINYEVKIFSIFSFFRNRKSRFLLRAVMPIFGIKIDLNLALKIFLQQN